MLGCAIPWEWTTSIPSSAFATRAFSPIPTAQRATDPLPRIGIEIPRRTVR
jgi:hypothetical protein